jgi:hypothetical protein
MNELKPCPFCGERPEVTKHFKEDMYRLIHRCKVLGPVSFDWSDKEPTHDRWNTRAELELYQTGDSNERTEGQWLG